MNKMAEQGSLRNPDHSVAAEKPEAKRIRVRPATPMDTVNVAKLFKRMLGEALMPLTPAVDSNLVPWVSYVISKELCAVAEIADRLVGTIAFSAYRPPWGDETLMKLDWFYVTPPYRQRGTSEVLLKLVEDWAKTRKLRIYGSILNGTYSGAFNKRINETGYHKVGLTFLKDFGDAK